MKLIMISDFWTKVKSKFFSAYHNSFLELNEMRMKKNSILYFAGMDKYHIQDVYYPWKLSK